MGDYVFSGNGSGHHRDDGRYVLMDSSMHF